MHQPASQLAPLAAVAGEVDERLEFPFRGCIKQHGALPVELEDVGDVDVEVPDHVVLEFYPGRLGMKLCAWRDWTIPNGGCLECERSRYGAVRRFFAHAQSRIRCTEPRTWRCRIRCREE
jgi:hypothetical protein